MGRKVPSFIKYGFKLFSPTAKSEISITDLLKSTTGNSLVVFLTHCGDLSSFEVAQQLVYYLPQLEEAKINLLAVSPGSSISSAEEFCSLTKFPINKLYLDIDANFYSALDFEKGFLPDAKISPYIKLLPMLVGIKSPGTISSVLKGYFGDRKSSSKWIRESLKLVGQERFDVLGADYQRPFELATLRLQNAMDVVNNWSKLAPDNKELLTQLGGAYIFNSKGEVIYEHKDTGILSYVDIKSALKTAGTVLV